MAPFVHRSDRLDYVHDGWICVYRCPESWNSLQKSQVSRRKRKKVEEEVLEAAEAERRGEQIGVPEVAIPEDTDTPEVAGPTLAQAASSPEQDSTPLEEPVSEDNPASAWTDEQLISAGWTQDQIDAMPERMKSSENPKKGDA